MKPVKKSISVLLVLFLLLLSAAPAFSAGSPRFYFETKSNAGSELQLILKSENCVGLSSADILISYDTSVLTYQSKAWADGFRVAMMDWNTSESGTLRGGVVWSSYLEADAAFMVFTFTVKDPAATFARFTFSYRSYSFNNDKTLSGSTQTVQLAAPRNGYTVSYNANGGTGAPAAQTKTEGQTLTLSTAKPQKSYTLTYQANGGAVSQTTKSVACAFKAWNTKADGTGTSYAPGAAYTANAAATLYAQYTDPAAGVLASPTRAGYDFAGWYTAASGGTQVTASTVLHSNLTVYAHWKTEGSAGAPRFYFEKQANSGSELQLILKSENCVGLRNTDVIINYDTSVLAFQSLEKLAVHKDTYAEWNTRETGTVRGFVISLDYLTADEAYVLLTFTVNDTTATAAEFKFSYANYSFENGKTLSDSKQTVQLAAPKKTYTVSYNANGGTGAPAAQTKTEGQTLTLSTAKPQKSYTLTYQANGGAVSQNTKSVACAFKAWNTKADGTGTSYAPGAAYTANAAATLYAQYTDPAAGTLAAPTRAGYAFAGWYTAASGGTQVTASTVLHGNLTVYAHWQRGYTVTFHANGGSNAPAAQKKNAGESIKLSESLPTKSYTLTYNANGGSVSMASKKVNCTFKAWNTASNGAGTAYKPGGYYSADADATLYAQWANPTAGALPAATKTGASFRGWFTAKSGGTKITQDTVISSDLTLYAQYGAQDLLATSDIFSFNNSSYHFNTGRYTISDADFNKLAKYVRKIYGNGPYATSVINKLQSERISWWGGSCYGMAVTTILDKRNQIAFNENLAHVDTMRLVPSPNQNAQVMSCINYYFLTQMIDYIRAEAHSYSSSNTALWRNGLKELVNKAQAGKLMLFCYWFSRGGHAIVIKGCRAAADGGYELIAYDNRYANRDVIVKIDKNFSTCIVDGSENCFGIEYADTFKRFDALDFDGPGNNNVLKTEAAESPALPEASDLAYIYVNALPDTSVTIELENGSRIVFCNGEITGGGTNVASMQLMVGALTDSGETLQSAVIAVSPSESYTVRSSSGEAEVEIRTEDWFTGGSFKNASYMLIEGNGDLHFDGSDYSFTAHSAMNNNYCDMVSFSGSALSNTAFQHDGADLLVSGVDGSNCGATVFSNDGDMDQVAFRSGYDRFKVTSGASDASGEIAIYASRNGGLTYTVDIMGGEQAFVPGDVNGDGAIGADDARLALRTSVDLEPYAAGSREYKAGDVNKDGSVGADDARLILRASVDLEDLTTL